MKSELKSALLARSIGFPAVASLSTTLLLAACGGGGGSTTSSNASTAAVAAQSVGADTGTATTASTQAQALSIRANPTSKLTLRDAQRMADQATFGPNEALIQEILTKGLTGWLTAQMALPSSHYASGKGGELHQNTQAANFCDTAANTSGNNCFRDWYSSQPLLWDFYRNATANPDQLRQRIAYTLGQIVVVSALQIEGTYGLRNYHNALLDNAFGNYRQILKKVALSPVMGDYLNNVNNSKSAPNENFPRELLQLFSIGTCLLNPDGTLQGGTCNAPYGNDTVRSYAYALTGWTYPVGGATSYGCWPQGTNCKFYGGDMVAASSYHDTTARPLLSGVVVPAGSSASSALELVLDSLMAHPNIAPFIGRQLIQHLVSSNPSPAYVARVATAFNSGKYGTFGSGAKGDLAATVAAVLMDTEARTDSATSAGKLREPVLMFTGPIRALNGQTDGDALGWWWGELLREHIFRAPSVFNFYSPDFPVAGTSLVGPAFGIHNASAALQRLNFMEYLMQWGGSAPDPAVPGATGTKIDLTSFAADAADAGKLVDRISNVAIGKPLPAASRTAVINAVSWWTPTTDAGGWMTSRAKAAAHLIFASPDYQIQH